MIHMIPKVLYAILFVCFTSVSFAQNQQDARRHIESVAKSKIEFNPDRVLVCSQHGCKKISQVSIDKATWGEITSRFNTPNLAAATERALLAEYIADVEKVMGRKTHTNFDVGGTFNAYFTKQNIDSNQMDCIDESTNTLSYLKMLEVEHKIKSHEIVGLVSRGGLLAGYPHTAVLIEEFGSNEKYVVDSWFYNNGRPAVILPYKTWKIGWIPN